MSVSHKKAPVKVIENISKKGIEDIIEIFLSHPNISECAPLLTCNRAEIYVAGNGVLEMLRKFSSSLGIEEKYIEYLSGKDCLRHILKVSSGIESMAVGEDQILGQVREWYKYAKNHGWIGEFLDFIFLQAIKTGKRVRHLTGINKGSVSIGSIAVDFAESVLGDLKDKKYSS